MSTEKNKPSFVEEAVAEICALAIQYGYNGAEQDDLERLAIKLLKDSFKNGLNAGYRKAKGESKAKSEN